MVAFPVAAAHAAHFRLEVHQRDVFRKGLLQQIGLHKAVPPAPAALDLQRMPGLQVAYADGIARAKDDVL